MRSISKLFQKAAADAHEAIRKIDQELEHLEQLKKARAAYAAVLSAVEGSRRDFEWTWPPKSKLSPEARRRLSERGIAAQQELRRLRREQESGKGANDAA